MDQVNTASPYEMNSRNLGITLVIGWGILPIAACGGAIFAASSGPQGIMSVAVSVFLTVPYIVGTAMYTTIAISRCLALPRTRIWPRLLLFVPLVAVVSWAIVANATPRRLTPAPETVGPFDEYWTAMPQTAYGRPLPYLRFFDEAVPSFGESLFDYSTFLFDLTIWCFLVFVVVSLAYTLLPPQRKDDQTNVAEHVR